MHGILRGTIAMFPALSPREVCVSVCVKFPSVKFTLKLCVFVAYRVSTCLRAETRDQHNSVTRPGMLKSERGNGGVWYVRATKVSSNVRVCVTETAFER